VTEETLNLERKEELIGRLNAMIKEIQLLKVKKEMQVALAKKDTRLNENEIRSLKEQLEKVRKEGDKRIAHFQKKIEKVAGEIETIRKENKQLETQKWNLEATVRQREKIKEMMVGEHGEGNQEAK
jgi:histidinol dehydrogenase